MKGNMDTPTLATMPAMPTPPASSAASGRRMARQSAAITGPARPSAGTTHSAGWVA